MLVLSCTAVINCFLCTLYFLLYFTLFSCYLYLLLCVGYSNSASGGGVLFEQTLSRPVPLRTGLQGAVVKHFIVADTSTGWR